MAAVNRILALCVGVIPGLALPPVLLVRNCSALKLPRMLTLGMMITLNFFPLLGDEVRKVREAMVAVATRLPWLTVVMTLLVIAISALGAWIGIRISRELKKSGAMKR